MAFENRMYTKGERGHFIYDQFKGSARFNKYFYIKTGVIEDIDPNKYEMTVRWSDGNGVRDRVPISFAYASPAAMMGALPEKGSIGIFHFYNEGTGKGSPLLVSYLSTGLSAGLNNNSVKIYPDSLSSDDINNIEFSHRKLTPRDMIMASSDGGLIFLNNNIEISDRMLDTILIREEDQSIISNSVNHFVFGSGVGLHMGPALRNSLPVYDLETGLKLDNNASPVSLLLGKDNIYITPHGEPVKYGSKLYTEYRIDVSDQAENRLPLNDIIGNNTLSYQDPLVTLALGNYIGADHKNHLTYGNILKARLFSSSNDKIGAFGLERAKQDNGVDEPSITGLAYALHFLKSNCFIGIDKEGHYYLRLPASKANPLGAGRSMSLLADGNLKEIWGQTSYDSNSWDLTTKGGVVWDIGAHNSKNNRYGRSIDITTSKGVNIDVQGSDNDGYAKLETLQGNVQETITGDKTVTVRDLTMLINGAKTETISGGSIEALQGTKSVHASDYTETIVNLKQQFYGNRKTTISNGDDVVNVLKGSIVENIPLGNKRTTIGSPVPTEVGNAIEENITAGNRKTKIIGGNYIVDITSGAVNIKTLVGTVTVTGTTVTINGKVIASIKAPLIELGNNPVKGGMIVGLPGVPSHFDYMTGVPHKGSMTVSATV